MKFSESQREGFDLKMESSIKRRAENGVLFGVAVNDVDFPVAISVGRCRVAHRAYAAWLNMLNRCYSNSFATYKDAIVCNEWLYFRNFLAWWKLNHVNGWEIDKDMLCDSEKIYSPETCVYVPKKINKFLTLRGNDRGGLALGVTLQDGKFRARISDGTGRRIHLGYFGSEMEAHKKWLSAKLIMASDYRAICDKIDVNLYPGMVRFIKSEAEKSIR